MRWALLGVSLQIKLQWTLHIEPSPVNKSENISHSNVFVKIIFFLFSIKIELCERKIGQLLLRTENYHDPPPQSLCFGWFDSPGRECKEFQGRASFHMAGMIMQNKTRWEGDGWMWGGGYHSAMG